jgi:hypothetical protein
MKVTPLHDRLIIQRLEEREQTIGGIIVPDSAKEKPHRGERARRRGGREPGLGSRERSPSSTRGVNCRDDGVGVPRDSREA